MNNFSVVKSKLFQKLTESYTKQDKVGIKDLLTKVNKNKDFKEMYLFYEEIENIELSHPESAQLYVETIEPLLIEKSQSIKNICEEISKSIGDIEYEKNEIYECLDILSQKSTLNNLDQKVVAKKKLIDHLRTKKETQKIENTSYTINEQLLYAVLVNNFNVLYKKTLSENEQSELKEILSISQENLNEKTNELKESIFEKINTLLTESTDDELNSKLNKVKEEVKTKGTSRINYYRLLELKNGLN